MASLSSSSASSFGYALLTAVLAAGAAYVLSGCASSDRAASDGDESEDELAKGAREQWIYDGPLPKLDEVTITVSQTVNTARVTGYLPDGYDVSQLPFYADAVSEDGRTKIAVVYPVATGESFNAQPNEYTTKTISPWTPTNAHAPWGGFPFISYDGGIAFHGPITAKDGQWHLLRGPVSHGCNRMQGEHVVELANLIGVDMSTRIYKGEVIHDVNVPVTVLRTADTWQGKPVDVDYPAMSSVKRPAGAHLFRTWSSNDFPRVVCALDKKRLTDPDDGVPARFCDYAPPNKYDLVAGPPR